MRIIAIISQKGGVGKSTLALHLAVQAQSEGRDTVIIDLDPQASSTEWFDVREAALPHVESIVPARLKKTLEAMQEQGADLVILDTAPHSEATALDAARAADLVLVPVKPSIMDIRAMTKTIDLLNLVKVPAYAVLNGVQHHSLVAAEQAAITISETLKFPVSSVVIGERVAFNRCLIDGQAAQEYEPGGKAASEISALYEWVNTLIGE